MNYDFLDWHTRRIMCHCASFLHQEALQSELRTACTDPTRTLPWPTQQASELALEGPQHECRYRWWWSWHWRGPNLALEVAVAVSWHWRGPNLALEVAVEVLNLNWNSVVAELALEGPTQQASELGLEVAVEVLSLLPALAAMYWPGDS